MTSGEDITVTVKVQALDPDATQANAQPLEGVGLAWLDMTTGTIKPIDGVVTDETARRPSLWWRVWRPVICGHHRYLSHAYDLCADEPQRSHPDGHRQRIPWS